MRVAMRTVHFIFASEGVSESTFQIIYTVECLKLVQFFEFKTQVSNNDWNPFTNWRYKVCRKWQYIIPYIVLQLIMSSSLTSRLVQHSFGFYFFISISLWSGNCGNKHVVTSMQITTLYCKIRIVSYRINFMYYEHNLECKCKYTRTFDARYASH